MYYNMVESNEQLDEDMEEEEEEEEEEEIITCSDDPEELKKKKKTEGEEVNGVSIVWSNSMTESGFTYAYMYVCICNS